MPHEGFVVLPVSVCYLQRKTKNILECLVCNADKNTVSRKKSFLTWLQAKLLRQNLIYLFP